jgi:hypothetical protein
MMNWIGRKARTFRINQAEARVVAVEQRASAHDVKKQQHVESLQRNFKEFCEQVFGFTPFSYQLDLEAKFNEFQFNAVRWPRQTGKSFIVSGLMLKYAIENPNSYIAVVGPSWRQTKLNVRRIGGFARKYLGCDKGIQKTMVSLPNGSVIEAFPNNPDTIRGPTFNVIWWEECNFTANDEDLYDAILFTLGTTDGKLIATSTPWNTDSLFWKMCNHKDYGDFGRTHISWQQALEPNGPLKAQIIEKIKRQFGDDPFRWRREMEAEWAEDEDVWLSQSLIASCVGTGKNCGEDLQSWDVEKGYEGELFAGLDLAQVRDYCVFSVFQRVNGRLLLRLLKIFQQPTKYATVIAYMKMLQDRWGGFQKIRVDFTKEGPSFISDMEAAGIKNAEGVNFSVPRKSEMFGLLKQRMMNGELFYPLLTWERPYRGDICVELNVERFELRKDGALGFSHPNGTHDDVFCSMALGVYCTVEMKEFDLEALRFG